MSNAKVELITEEAPQAPVTGPVQPSLWQLLRVWFMLGLQSFGGGTATLFLIRRAVVEQHHWVSEGAFTRDWALCQAAPGINLLCMTILLGRQVAGLPGALVAMAGLMLPSVAITIVMTALYADLRNLSMVQAALRGIVPATVGMGLLLSTNMARPLLASSRRESASSLSVGILLLVGSAAAVQFWHLPVIVVLCAAGAIGALNAWYHASQAKVGQP